MWPARRQPPSVLLILCGLALFVSIRLISPSFSISFLEESSAEKDAQLPPEVAKSDTLPVPIDKNLHRNSTTLRHPNFLVDFPLCLVHVGKAAGSSVSCGLGLTYANCEGMPRDKLPNTHFMHMRRNNCPKEDTKTYVATLRNPLTRIQSWFDFEKDILPSRNNPQEQESLRKKRGLLFVDCYNNFVDFALNGLQPLPNRTVSVGKPIHMTCNERAWAAALGVRSFSYHEWYNYEHYWNLLHRNRLTNNQTDSSQLLVLRTEHLLEDWSTLSREPLFRPVNRRKNYTNATTSGSQQQQPLSSAIIANLCRALCPELQMYKRFLLLASNLDQKQKQQSLEEVQTLCPLETMELRECSDIPKFPLMNVPRRQYQAETKQRLFRIKK